MANSRPALWETLQLVVILFYSPRLQPFTTITGWWLSLPLWKIWRRQLFTLFPTEWKVIKAMFQTTNRIFISTSSSKKSAQSPNLPFIRISLPQIAWKVQKSLPSSPPLEGAFHGCLPPFTQAVGSNWDAHLKLVLTLADWNLNGKHMVSHHFPNMFLYQWTFGGMPLSQKVARPWI